MLGEDRFLRLDPPEHRRRQMQPDVRLGGPGLRRAASGSTGHPPPGRGNRSNDAAELQDGVDNVLAAARTPLEASLDNSDREDGRVFTERSG
jgi:hypothetical protein